MSEAFTPLPFHPLANIFPLIEGVDFDALVEDIRVNGLHDPIVLLDGKILDGRNRYRALVRLFETGEVLGNWDFDSGKALPRARIVPGEEDAEFGDYVFVAFDQANCDPLAYVLSKNLTRRHLNESQRAMVAAKLATLSQGRPAEKPANLPVLIEGDGDGVQDANLHPEPQVPGLAQADAAKTLNVSERSVRTAKTVLVHGAPELQRAVEAGEVSVSAAADLASLPADAQTEIVARGEAEILKAAKEINAEKRERRRAERFANIAEIARANAPLPANQKYPVIYADPPWRFDSGFGDRSIENHYPTMSVDDIRALPVRDLATPDAVLFMWVTVPHLENAFAVMRDWGFAYVSSAMWDKEDPITGYWFFNQHEILLVGTRGNFPAPDPVIKARSVYREKRRLHSAKPDYYYGLIERMTPGLPRIELFSRGAHPGWDAWGNQAGNSRESESTGGVTVAGSADHENGNEPERDTSSAGQTKAVNGGVTAGETAPQFDDAALDIPDFLKRDKDNSSPATKGEGANVVVLPVVRIERHPEDVP